MSFSDWQIAELEQENRRYKEALELIVSHYEKEAQGTSDDTFTWAEIIDWAELFYDIARKALGHKTSEVE